MSKARDIADSTTTLDVDGGTIKLDGNYPVGTGNVALGDAALDSVTTGGSNVAIGSDALTANTTGSSSTAVGYQAAYSSNANYVTAVGRRALYSNTSGINLAVGDYTGYSTTTGSLNTVVGNEAFQDNTTGSSNVAVGKDALHANTTASDNTAVGYKAGTANTTGTYNTFVGKDAGFSNTTSSNSSFFGEFSGRLSTGASNTFYGQQSGHTVTTGSKNTIIGRYSGNQGGLDIRTGTNAVVLSDGDGEVPFFANDLGEVIIGTSLSPVASRYFAVSSDMCHSIGDIDREDIGLTALARLLLQERSGDWISFMDGNNGHYGTISVSGSGVSYGSNSDYRLKENISDLTGAITRVKTLQPKRFNFLSDTTDTLPDGFLAHEVQAVIPEAVTGSHDGTVITGNVEDANGKVVKTNVRDDVELESGETFVPVKTEPQYQQLDTAKIVPVLTAALQEAISKIEALETNNTALEARITALEAN